MPRFSILTPSFNRIEFLPKLINSLKEQNFNNFEWIIGNDGSTDGTHDFLLEELSNINFPATYIHADLRVGKSTIDNLLLDNASGEYLIWCDSDDFFLHDALRNFSDEIDKRKINFSEDVYGVIAQNLDTAGVTQTFNPSANIPIDGVYSWEDIENFMVGDGTICIKKEVFINQRWPEVDFLIIESVLLRELYHSKNFYFTSAVVKVMDRTAENSVSHGKKMQYCKGSAYALAHTIGLQEFTKMSFLDRVLKTIHYFRYCIHGDIALMQSLSMWPVIFKKPYMISFYVISLVLAFYDIWRNKVEKTHVEFNQNKEVASINIQLF